MSLVTTPSRSWSPSSRQRSPMSEDLPVPTGPATPSRKARVVSGTEEPPEVVGVLVQPGLQLRGGGGWDVVRLGEVGHGVDQRVDSRVGVQEPLGRLDRVERGELEGGGA